MTRSPLFQQSLLGEKPDAFGLAVSARTQKELWPRAVDWLVQRTD